MIAPRTLWQTLWLMPTQLLPRRTPVRKLLLSVSPKRRYAPSRPMQTRLLRPQLSGRVKKLIPCCGTATRSTAQGHNAPKHAPDSDDTSSSTVRASAGHSLFPRKQTLLLHIDISVQAIADSTDTSCARDASVRKRSGSPEPRRTDVNTSLFAGRARETQ